MAVWPWWINVIIAICLLAVFFVYVIWPCFGNSAEADEKRRKRWDKKFRELHPELYEEEK